MCIRDRNKLGQYNFSQGTVVRNKKVIAIEGKGGTEKMLRKCKSKKYTNTGVLVKFPKKKQDLRVDLPAAGLKTLKQCKIAGLRGIVLKNKCNVFLEKNKCINFADKNKIMVNFLGTMKNEELLNLLEKYMFYISASKFEGNPKIPLH